MGHPTTALLVVEVSASPLALDRGAKSKIYARAGIEDYWILNLAQKQLEIYRGIVIEPGRRARVHYAQPQILAAGQSIAPLACPQSPVAAAHLMPWR
jgi:Uma2 family endonuclease